MKIFKVTVKPGPNKSYEIRLSGQDDTGRILNSVTVAPNLASVGDVTSQALRSMQSLAAKFTEEESFEDAKSK
jgi:hypothetical protein